MTAMMTTKQNSGRKIAKASHSQAALPKSVEMLKSNKEAVL
jgi:hypothetical protein